jgi:hypothetical protein
MYLLPPKAIVEVSKVLTFGAAKYDEENWRYLDKLQERYTGATLRHLFSHMDGEQRDSETGYSHLAHAICCLLFKLEIELEKGVVRKKALDIIKGSTEEDLYGAWCEEEGRRESQRQQYKESYTITFSGVTNYEKTGLRSPEYSIQYDPIGQNYRGISREEGVCKTPQKPITWPASVEYRSSRDGYCIYGGGELPRNIEADLPKPCVCKIRN